MSLRYKPFEQIGETDLQTLIDNKQQEGKEIEYKEQLPRDLAEEKKEFLADVSSFANCVGGDLLYGVREERDAKGRPTGLPSEIVGVGVTNLDTEILRLENLIRDGIEPRITGVSMRPVSITNLTPALVIRIPRSWVSPHMMTYQGSSKFFSRNSAGKYPLDVGEIRTAFLRGEALGQRVREFRAERLALISSNQTPVPLEDTAKIVLHIVPLQAFEPGVQFDVIRLAADPTKLEPIRAYGWSYRYNFDGVLGYAKSAQSSKTYSYLLAFRNGIIEAVETSILRPRDDKSLRIHFAFEREILNSAQRFLTLQQELGVDPPLLLMLTLLGVRGYEMWVSPEHYFVEESHPIDRDSLLISDVLIEDYSCDVEAVLRPCFDAVCNAAGLPRSMN